jgi:lipopolysaccharide/colanic/teichoic acid biosynthesis glycosyltransferase
MKAHQKPIFRTLFDQVIALVLLLITMPLLLIGLISLWILGDRPITVSEDGESQDGAPFHIYRFRTEGADSPAYRRIGRVLRDFQIDRLPGLWSVVTGHAGLKPYLNSYLTR